MKSKVLVSVAISLLLSTSVFCSAALAENHAWEANAVLLKPNPV